MSCVFDVVKKEKVLPAVENQLVQFVMFWNIQLVFQNIVLILYTCSDLQHLMHHPFFQIFRIIFKTDFFWMAQVVNVMQIIIKQMKQHFLLKLFFYIKLIQGKLVSKLTLGPFLTLSVRNERNMQSYLFQAYISINPSRVKQNG